MSEMPKISERKLSPGDTESIDELRARNLRSLENNRERKNTAVSTIGQIITKEVLTNPAPSDVTLKLTNAAHNVVVGNYGYVGPAM
jgi:hypothetical protein